jgi:two-component system, cell cycle response regulator
MKSTSCRPLPLTSPCSVLVVDDDELTRAQLMSTLNRAGFSVRGAGSGLQALSLLSVAPSQIVLTDWEMPDMNGPSLCRALRLREGDRDTYLVMLTVRSSAADIVMALGAGADDYLVKGVSIEDLMARIAVGRRSAHTERPLSEHWARQRHISMTDSLTGAHNHRFLTTYLPRELARSRRFRPPISVLSCDIDRCRQINSSFGHEIGDQVLQSFVALSLSFMREATDWIARVGGDEFVIILPETTLIGAGGVAERIRGAFAEHEVQTSPGSLKATVSIGVTALETPDELAATSVVELLSAAQRCMYLSKRHGRDRTTGLPPAQVALLSFADSAESKYGVH